MITQAIGLAVMVLLPLLIVNILLFMDSEDD